MAKEKLTLKEKLVNSLLVKRKNLQLKRSRVTQAYETEIKEIDEKLEVVNLQLAGLKK